MFIVEWIFFLVFDWYRRVFLRCLLCCFFDDSIEVVIIDVVVVRWFWWVRKWFEIVCLWWVNNDGSGGGVFIGIVWDGDRGREGILFWFCFVVGVVVV